MPRREFPAKVRAMAFLRANGKCEGCGAVLALGKFHYDHEIPAAFGGGASLANCSVLCLPCHREKTSEADVPEIAKSNRIRRREMGIRQPSRFPAGRGSKWKKKHAYPVVTQPVMATAKLTDGVAAQLRVRRLEAFIRKLEGFIRRIHEREWPAGDKDKAAKHAAEMWAIADEARQKGEF